MRFVLDCSILGRQAERVPAHGMQHVETAHALHPRYHVANRIIAHVAHVQRAARIGQHFEDVVFWLGWVGFGFENTSFSPSFLPLGFDLLRVVTARCCSTRTRCVLLRHAGYLLLRALIAIFDLFCVLPFLLLAAELFFLGELRVRCDLCAAIFLFSAGVSIE